MMYNPLFRAQKWHFATLFPRKMPFALSFVMLWGGKNTQRFSLKNFISFLSVMLNKFINSLKV